MPPPTPKALVFDVFGTCVDWRGSIIAEGPDPKVDLAVQGFEELASRLGC